MWRPDVARRRPIGEILEKKKPASMFARARHSLDDATVPMICPDKSNRLSSFSSLGLRLVGLGERSRNQTAVRRTDEAA